MKSFCPKCGAEVASNSIYCAYCGTTLTENANAATDWENPYASTAAGTTSAREYLIEEYRDPTAPDIPGFFGAFAVCMKKYFSCKGRASRSEFWYFQLSSLVLILLVGAIVGGALGATNPGKSSEELNKLIAEVVVPLGNVMRLFFFIPTVAVCCRRLQDCGRSSWLLLWFFLPWFGVIVSFLLGGVFAAYGPIVFVLVFIVFGVLLVVRLGSPGTPGTNKYGPAPWKR